MLARTIPILGNILHEGSRLTQSSVAFHSPNSPFHIENLAVREKQGTGLYILFNTILTDSNPPSWPSPWPSIAWGSVGASGVQLQLFAASPKTSQKIDERQVLQTQ